MKLQALYEAQLASGAILPDPEQQRAVGLLDQVMETLSQNPAPRRTGLFRRAKPALFVPGLYLWGGVGRGKSMLMDLATQVCPVPNRRMHFHAFMQWVHDRMDVARKSGVDDAIKPVAQELADDIRLLAFDEVQITDIADAMIVGRLFESLFERGVTMISTSNRAPEDLYKNGLNRQLFLPFIDLINTRMTVHMLDSATDYRQEVLSGAVRYFAPADAAARQALDRIWSGLGGDQAKPHVIRVKGRDVPLPLFHSGSARARFHDLCAAMLGPGDYLAVADQVRVLILDDIPLLSRNNFNEAKRFVTLIDALYEARVRLFCSAAAEPEKLYVEGEGAFEFERTASRLREMQGADWGI